MEYLNNEALIKARRKIQEQFNDVSSLDDIPSLREQLEKKFAAAEAQLNGAVQSKLDSLKRSVDLIDDSSRKVYVVS